MATCYFLIFETIQKVCFLTITGEWGSKHEKEEEKKKGKDITIVESVLAPHTPTVFFVQF